MLLFNTNENIIQNISCLLSTLAFGYRLIRLLFSLFYPIRYIDMKLDEVKWKRFFKPDYVFQKVIFFQHENTARALGYY